jgi:hypothetical protein
MRQVSGLAGMIGTVMEKGGLGRSGADAGKRVIVVGLLPWYEGAGQLRPIKLGGKSGLKCIDVLRLEKLVWLVRGESMLAKVTVR